MFTQPIMYKNIQKQEAITDTYAKKLLQEGVVNEEWIQVCTPNKLLLLILKGHTTGFRWRTQKLELPSK